jgi:multicomponent Na+:H+ antiporter subunit B
MKSARLALFLPSCAVFTGIFASSLLALHPVGSAQAPATTYGNTVNAISVNERHITDAVTAVNFDIRGFDTLGEEFILFASVMGVLLILRRHPDEQRTGARDLAQGRRIPRASDAVRILSVSLSGPIVVFGLYLVTHGQVSPGGGFQGGVILATAPLLIYLAGEFRSLRKLIPPVLVETAEAIGAGGYVLIGAIGLLFREPFLYNLLPLGKPGDVLSGGTVALIDLSVGLAVAGGFTVLLKAFLDRVLLRRDPL